VVFDSVVGGFGVRGALVACAAMARSAMIGDVGA
jgi:hypothetical protein